MTLLNGPLSSEPKRAHLGIYRFLWKPKEEHQIKARAILCEQGRTLGPRRTTALVFDLE